LADEPISAYLAAVVRYEAKVKEHPEKSRYREALARVRSNLGNALHLLGRNAEAESLHRTAIIEFGSWLISIHRVCITVTRLAVARSNLAWILKSLGRMDEANYFYRESIDEYNKIIMNLALVHPPC